MTSMPLVVQIILWIFAIGVIISLALLAFLFIAAARRNKREDNRKQAIVDEAINQLKEDRKHDPKDDNT